LMVRRRIGRGEGKGYNWGKKLKKGG